MTKQALGKKGQQLTIKFKIMLNGIEALLELQTVIRAINVDQSGETETPYQLGIQFVDVSSEDSIPLLAYVYQRFLKSRWEPEHFRLGGSARDFSRTS